ncbi:YhdP family protein [Halomonas korlensis]|uniref:TIGR02099 family protein n=1 Tax=Halomonas korlensis TaxID=463301 RepID=A0A1I7JWT2_9GAMM|nr:AsmA-like C-terminal region-containing protein [Halomonas korlensis]SFU89637.1 TIGR02099 family protein [Halomonas korlensis]
MSVTRSLTRWLLTLAALLLALMALVLLSLRLGLGLADLAKPRIEALLSARFEAVVEIRELDGGLSRLDPHLSLAGLSVRSRTGLGSIPLIEVEQGHLRLNTLASLRDGLPVVEDARLRGITVHVYQDAEGLWHWPDPAELPGDLFPDTAFNLDRLDFWIGALLRQRAWVEDVQLILHGQEQRAVLKAPQLLMTGDARRTHLEGIVYLNGERDAAIQAVLEIQPGQAGLRDFNAALQADMRLGSLMGLAELVGRGAPLRLETASGDAQLWGRWQSGELADVRLDVKVPLLAMSHDARSGELRTIVLETLAARGQWLRREDGWEAWLEGEAGSADWDAPEALFDASGPALPTHWHIRRRGDDWWLNTSEFALDAMAAWRDRLPLPGALDRAIATLNPRGRVAGLRVGREDDQWLARAALHDVEVSPWQRAPGGGPLDMWVEARDLNGKVRFVGDTDSRLVFPDIYADPIALDHARGEVVWSYDGPRSVVSGRNLAVGWQGSEVTGGFGLSAGKGQRGGLGLTLDFRDIDAIDTPLLQWLPVGILSDNLLDWLGNGVSGRVPEGSLRLHVPMAGGGERVDPTFGLSLAVEEGRLPIAQGWPFLEGVEGQLRLQDKTLEATVERAQSLGVEAREGRVVLDDGRLEIDGALNASAEALRRFLLSMPVEGIEAVESWRGEGQASGELALSLPLEEPEALALEIATRVDFPWLEYRPLGLLFRDLEGPLTWRQRDEEGGLVGRVAGRLLGGPVSADIDTPAGGLDLSGSAEGAALGDMLGSGALGERVDGRFDWQGRLSLADGANALRLDSNLQGLEIVLPAPLGKSRAEPKQLRVDVGLDEGRIEGRFGEQLQLRWRELTGAPVGQGQVWLGRTPTAGWPREPGWWVEAYQPRIELDAWGDVLASLQGGGGAAEGADLSRILQTVQLETDCLAINERCLGWLDATASPRGGGGWGMSLDGSLGEGRLDYRPGAAEPLDIALERLSLDRLIPAGTSSGNLFDEIATPPAPEPFPAWIAELPNGRLRIADIERQGRRFGPFTARWQASGDRLTIAPLGLSLGEIAARGELVWEAAGPADSLSRARLDLDGRDLGTAMERLGQPASIRSAETHVESQLAWPGAPWQFALERSRGSIEASLRDGRFVNLESPSARLVGLLNVDNLLRRLRLDFSDVTGQGTSFDRVTGAATLYGGILETRGPVEVEGPATRFTLEGQVDLQRRELDQRLGVTVPVSRNLPLAAVIAGAPVIGGALFIADKLFGDAIDRVTRIHYRVRGPWTSPQISVENAE